MRWTAKPLEPPKKLGQKRTVKRFAFFPTRVDDDEDRPLLVWLEPFYKLQELKQVDDGYGWTWGWVTLSKHSADNAWLFDNRTALAIRRAGDTE